MDIIKTLKKYLQETGTSQTQLAEKLGVSFQTVNRWLNGKVRPGELQIRKISQFLKSNALSPEVTPSQPQKRTPQFKNPIQKRIYESLKLVGEGPAASYKDACAILQDSEPFDCASHIIGHLLREIDSSLRDVLLLLGEKSGKTKPPKLDEVFKLLGLKEVDEKAKRIAAIFSDTRRQEIEAVLNILGIDKDSKEAQDWIDAKLHKMAHRRQLEKPRPIGKDFLESWQGMEKIFLVLSERLAANYTSYINQIDQILKVERPQRLDVEKLAKIPRSFTTMQHLFEKLKTKSPAWLPLLQREGYFSEPPAPEYDSEKKATYYTLWPASRYLVHMSATKAVDPEEIFKIISAVPKTGNPRIHLDFVDCALYFPPKIAVALLGDVEYWLSVPYQFSLPHKLCSLAESFAKAYLIDEALLLASTVFKISAVPAKPLSKKYGRHAELKTLFDSWHYQDELKKLLPSLSEYCGLKGFVLLADMLDQAITKEGRQNKEDADFSYVWCSNLREYKDTDREIKKIITLIVRQFAKSLIEHDQNILSTVIQELEKHKWSVFKRIVLDILDEFSELAPQLIAEKTMNKSLFDAYWATHEYWTLVNKVFDVLGPESQQILLDWIEAGPHPKEKDSRAIEIWKRDRFGWISSHLTKDYKARYQILAKKYGVPPASEIISVRAGWSGPTSPKSADDLRVMSAASLIAYLKEWKESEPFWGDSVEGLARSISGAIGQEPERYIANLKDFVELDPTYVRSVLEGYEEAAKAKRTFDWSAVLWLCKWVIDQPREIPNRSHFKRYSGRDLDWGWARKRVVSLIEAGFVEVPVGIPFELRKNVWEVIEVLTHDPEPSPDNKGMEPVTMSINTVRGEAIHSVIRYGLWVRRNYENTGDVENLRNGFDSMPEVKKVLEERLDTKIERSEAIRAVYGQWLPWLVLFDSQWVSENIRNIFPKDKKTAQLSKAAWDAYISYAAPYDNVFEVLKEEYEYAISSLDEHEKSSHATEGLINHIMTFAYRGKVDLHDKNSLLYHFWRNASLSVKKQAMDSLGRMAYNTKEEMPDKIKERFQIIWSERLESSKKSKDQNYQKTLSPFGWWFISKKFDDLWSLKQLISVLELPSSVDPATLVIERLAELSKQYPELVVRALTLLVQEAEDEWLVTTSKDQIQSIVNCAFSHEKTKKMGQELLGHLAAKGHLGFNSPIATV